MAKTSNDMTVKPRMKPDSMRLQILDRATRFDQARLSETSPWRRMLMGLRRQFQPYYFVQPPVWRILVRNRWSKDRAVPDFALLGAVRSGTTQLADYLLQHPCVVLPLAKELSQRVLATKYIKAQFPTRRELGSVERRYGKAITGYCTPIVPNLAFPFFASAIAPKAKVVVILRDPVDRTFAHWRWDNVLIQRLKKDPLWQNRPEFDEIVQLEISALRESGFTRFQVAGAGCGYVQHSIYYPFLKLLRRFYPAEQILCLAAEDFFSGPTAVVSQVHKFLDIPPCNISSQPVKNSAPPGKMTDATRNVLSEYFAPHNEKLYRLIGRDFGWQ